MVLMVAILLVESVGLLVEPTQVLEVAAATLVVEVADTEADNTSKEQQAGLDTLIPL